MSQDGSTNINQNQLNKLDKKAKEMGYTNLAFFIDDIDMLLRPVNLLKQKDMKYFELENLISLLISKDISLGMAPRMISMVSKYSERNEELEAENEELKQSNITMRSKYQTAEVQVKEYQKQLQELSVGSQTDARIREENIKLTEENKYLKMTNESLSSDLKKTKERLDVKLDEANNLEIENNQLELRLKDIQREIKDLEAENEELKKKDSGSDETKKRIEEVIEELDELYGTIDDPFKKEFVAFMGVELSELVDNRHISKQKVLNQIAIHAHEIEKIFEPRIAAMQQKQQQQVYTPTPVTPVIRESVGTKAPEPKDIVPEPVIKKTPTKEETVIGDEKSHVREENETGDRYVKPSEFLKGKSVHTEKDDEISIAEKPLVEGTEETVIPEVKTMPYVKKTKTKKIEEVDRTPSPELVKVFDVFIKYLEAISDNSSFNSLCDKLIEELYEHVGSPGMTQVYKIKSGGVKRKDMLIDLIKAWQKKLPDM
ncbi:MAG: hypothetical protein JXA54_00440 [Candidatus Heimdallarchaeota archaeon]|nr:hypothetical protein [Candidatus Heimdallarchaeota archaeon]